MAQPAHASGLQNQEGEGEADFYQAEAVNADLVPVEANPAAEKGDVLRALADLCFSHTPGKFIQPHVIPYFLKACLPERFLPKREKGGDTTVQTRMNKRLGIKEIPGYKLQDKRICSKYMSGCGFVYRNVELHPPSLEAQREPGPSPTNEQKRQWAAVQTLRATLRSPFNEFRWTHNEIVENADASGTAKKKQKTRHETMPPFVKMVYPYNFLRILVVDPFSDTVTAKILTPHSALISGIHTLDLGCVVPEEIEIDDDIPSGAWERELHLKGQQTFVTSTEPLVEIQNDLFAIEFELQSEALSRPAPLPTMREGHQRTTITNYFKRM